MYSAGVTCCNRWLLAIAWVVIMVFPIYLCPLHTTMSSQLAYYMDCLWICNESLAICWSRVRFLICHFSGYNHLTCPSQPLQLFFLLLGIEWASSTIIYYILWHVLSNALWSVSIIRMHIRMKEDNSSVSNWQKLLSICVHKGFMRML